MRDGLSHRRVVHAYLAVYVANALIDVTLETIATYTSLPGGYSFVWFRTTRLHKP